MDVFVVNCLLYANDLKIYCTIIDLFDRLLQNVGQIENWCRINKLLNPFKCNALTYILKTNSIRFNYIIDSQILSRPNTFKNLEVTMASKDNRIWVLISKKCVFQVVKQNW